MRTTKLLVIWLSIILAASILTSCSSDPKPDKDTGDIVDGDAPKVDADLEVIDDLRDAVQPPELKDTAPDKDTPVDPPDEIEESEGTIDTEIPVVDQCGLSCETNPDCEGVFADLGKCDKVFCQPVAACEDDEDPANDKQCVKVALTPPECCTKDSQCEEWDTSDCTCNEKCVGNKCTSELCVPQPDECCQDIQLRKFTFDNLQLGAMPSPDLMTQNTHTTKVVKWSTQDGPCGSRALYLGDPACRTYYNGQTDDSSGKCVPVPLMACTEATEDEDCPLPAQTCTNGFCKAEPKATQVWVELSVPEINLPANALYTVTFRLWMDAEDADDIGELTVDKLKLWVDPVEGSPEPLWTSAVLEENSTGGTCVFVSADLSKYAGKSISLRFEFDTLDGTSNIFEGVYIDDLTVRTYCGKDLCSANSECDDDYLCTTEDNCIQFANLDAQGVCDNFQPDPWCHECQEAGDCQGEGPKPDDLACYPPTCVDGLCQWLPNPACCLPEDLPPAFFDNGFESGDAAADGYTINEMPGSGGVLWHLVDGAGYNESPDVPDFDNFAIQFSNAAGDSYDCGITKCDGSVESPKIDLTVAPANAFVKLTFMLSLSTEWDGTDPAVYDFSEKPGEEWGIDVLNVYVVPEGGEPVAVWKSHSIFGTTNGETLPMWADLSAFVGKKITLKFEFDTGNVTPANNAFAGPIIDEITVESVCDEVCSAAIECGSGGPCDLPQCLAGSCDYGTPIPECCTKADDAACDDGNACTDDSCNVGQLVCKHDFTGDPQCCSAQAFIFNDNFEDPANFNPLQDDYPANGTWTVPKVGNQCPDGDCQDSESPETCPGDCNQAPVSWHEVDFDQFSGSRALYFGNPETQSYNNAPNKSFGTIRSPAFQMPPYGTPKVSFKLKLQTEHCDSWSTFVEAQDYDILTLSVVAGDDVDNPVWSGPVKIWDSMAWDIKGCTWDPLQGAAVWKTVQVGLGLGAGEMANLKGKALRFEFKFDTKDNYNNDFLGVLIDDFSVDVVCDGNCYCHDDFVETNPAEPTCTIETCTQGVCGSTPNPLVFGCCVQDDLVGYDFDAPCGMDKWVANPPAGQPRWQPHNGQKKSGSCSLYYGDPSKGTYDNDGLPSKGCARSPIINVTDPESDEDLYYSQVEVSYWIWMDLEDLWFWADSYTLTMDQVLFAGPDPVGIPKFLKVKPCSSIEDDQCLAQPIEEPCDTLGCDTLVMGQWVYVSFILDLTDYDWIPVSPYSAVFEFCFDSGDAFGNDGEGIYVDDFMVKTICK